MQAEPVEVGASLQAAGTPLHVDTAHPVLRLALVLPARVPTWLARFVRSARRRSWLAVTVVQAGDAPRGRAPRVPTDLRAYLAFERLRRWRSGRGMLARVDVGSLVPHVVAGGDDEVLRHELARLAPDLVILIGTPESAAVAAACARWGCWQIDADLGDRTAQLALLLAPLLRGDLATAIGWRLDFEAPLEPIALAAGNEATHAGSFALQREQVLRKLPSLLLRSLREVRAGRIRLPAHGRACLRMDGAAHRLRFGDGLRAFNVSMRRTLLWRRRMWGGEDPWFLALRTARTPIDPAAPAVGAITALVAPAGRYWADPCIVEHAGERLLFIEEYGYRDSRGVIVCVRLDADGSAHRLGIALEESWHLSYPQAFEADGAWYLTVESGSVRKAGLYRAASFPLRWEHVGDLLDGCVCVDPTLHRHGEHWYLFANVSESGGSTCDELFLFVADTLHGPYRPHPANPIVCDVRRARPAGRLFERDGRLIRPAQDCAPDYGAAIVFNEVLELSPTAYREQPLSRIDPDWLPGLWGCHTYSSIDGCEVIDGRGHPTTAAHTAIGDDALLARDARVTLPVVSVLMPVYNGERFIAEAIESALAQTLHNIEVVVVDDGSTDSSGAIADRYASAHPQRVRVVHQRNQGLPLARNAAIEAARGRYLALLDADDVWLPHHLADCVAVLERDPTVGLVHADAEDIDADGNRFPADDEARWGRDSRDPYSAVLLRRQHIVCPTAVFRRAVVDQVGAFDAAFNRLGCEDRDMWLRIAEAAGVVYLAGLHARYRIHGSNMSANSERMWRARKLLVEKYGERPRGRPLVRRARAAIDADLGHELAREPAAWPALVAFARALRRDPLRMDAWKGLLRRVLVGRRPGALVRR